ncbi:MAG TPA: serine hydrolase domain-containing protein [Allosphingosinicella sp.]|nr:serine hydrolase domain-containing protein [Allosphingosinicella sp.]
MRLSARDAGGAEALAARLEQRIAPLVRRALEEWELPGGFSVAIVKDRRLVYQAAFGKADREAGTSLAADALFPIGSVTKTFTAALAVKLAARGVVDLDAPVQRYLPEGVTLHPTLTRVPVTLRTLLTHRQGWPRDNATRRNLRLELSNGYDPGIADPASFSRAEFQRGLALTQATLPPLEWSYSNLGFHFAAHVLELASGRGMEELLATEIAAPLGLADTRFRPSQAQLGRVPAGYVLDQRNDRISRVPPWTAGEVVGGSFLFSTAGDLGRYLATMMDRDATARLVGGRQWEAMLLRPYVEFIGGDIPRQQALAWQVTVFGRHGTIIRHEGEADGHNALVAVSRQRRLGLVLLTNNPFDANEALSLRLLLALFQLDAGEAA